MKINIIGLSGSGKSRLAKRLDEKLHIPRLELDTVFYKDGKLVAAYDQYMPHIMEYVSKPDWIIDGVYPVPVVFEKADIIVWLNPGLPLLLYRQWKRYITKKSVREQYGFFSTIYLSLKTIRRSQFLDFTPNIPIERLPERNLADALDIYKDKVIVCNSSKEVMAFVNKI